MGNLSRRDGSFFTWTIISSFTLPAAALVSALAAAPSLPLKASPDGRYLVDREGTPFFVHADTAWQAPKRLSVEEFGRYLDHREKLGFNTVMLHTFSKELTPPTNLYGQAPFAPLDDITKPVEAYWRHLDALLQLAEQRGFLVMIAPLWIRWGGNDPHGWRYQLNETNAPVYGRWLAQRYAGRKNLVWILGGDANPREKTAAINALGTAIKAAAPHHLLTVHNAPEHASARFFHQSEWLDINLAYTYRETPGQVLEEWNRAGKVRPIVLGESGYEEESNDGRGGTPWRVRRQAYGAILSGTLGGHAFGQKLLWRMDETWKQALDSPASKQMAHVRSLCATRAWRKLAPDQNSKLVTAGRGVPGKEDYVSAALARDGSFALIYLPQARPITVNLTQFGVASAGTVKARWFDPTSGGGEVLLSSKPEGSREFRPPGKNAAGDADWVLILEAHGMTAPSKPPGFPLKVSEDKRHLLDQDGRPFFIHGDSPWELFWQLTREETIELLDNRSAKGFNTLLLDVPPYTDWSELLAQTNRYGALPFTTPGDFATPNPAYFDHVEWCVREMKKRGMLAMLVCADLSAGGMWQPLYLKNGMTKCGDYGRWLGRRFKDHDNILWVLGGDRDPGDVREHVEALAQGLEEVVPHQLKTYHAGAKSSSVFFHHAPWLDLNMSYGYRDTYLFVWPDYQLTPTKPCFLAESGYEGENLDGRGGSPQRVRRQAYWAILSGACGHLYGSAAWTVQPDVWRKWLDSPGAQHMAHLGRFFRSLDWFRLVPDADHTVLTGGLGAAGSAEYATCAWIPDGSLAVCYLPSARPVTVDLGEHRGPVQARWFDPTTGEIKAIGGLPFSNAGSHEFAPPGNNAAGEPDWVLLLTTSP